MSARATAIEFVTESIHVFSDGPDFVSDVLDLLVVVFHFVQHLVEAPHPGDFVIRSLHSVDGSAARISD